MNTTSVKMEGTMEQGKASSRPLLVWVLFTLLVLLSVGALFGGGAFILGPDGHLIQMPFSHLKNSPFTNFLIPGILLFTFLGVYPMIIAYGLWKKPDWRWAEWLNPIKKMHWSWVGSLAAGVIVLVWITVEVLWVPFGIVHIAFWIVGAVIIGLTLLPSVRRYCLQQPV